MFDYPFDEPISTDKIADWLEISAIKSPQRTATRSELERVLRIAAFNEIEESDYIEPKILEVFQEIENRLIHAKEAYPFKVDYHGSIQYIGAIENNTAYIYCLLISYLGYEKTTKEAKLFEELSCFALGNYLAGNSISFGWPRQGIPTEFDKAIDSLCEIIGEGGKFRQSQTYDRKDDTLDLIGWKEFIDKKQSKIIVFGQCAGGKHWADKVTELQPKEFCEMWLMHAPLVPPIKSFFMPHNIELEKWELYARKTGLLFDRCRVAYWAHNSGQPCDKHIEWIQQKLQHL